MNENESDPEVRPSSSLQWMVLSCFALLVAAPVLLVGYKQPSQWAAAAAKNKLLAGDTEAAIADLRKTVAQSNDEALGIELASWLVGHKGGEGAKEATELCDRVLSRFDLEDLVLPKDTASNLLVKNALHLKLQGLLHLGRGEEAMKFVSTLNEQFNFDVSRNNLAYYRAISDIELDQARNQIEEEIKEVSTNSYWSNPWKLTLETRSEIAIGILQQRLGEWDASLTSLDDAVERKRTQIQNLKVTGEKAEEDVVIGLAALLTLRSLAYQELGHDNKCKKDQITIRRFYSQNPSDLTERYLNSGLKQFDEALEGGNVIKAVNLGRVINERAPLLEKSLESMRGTESLAHVEHVKITPQEDEDEIQETIVDSATELLVVEKTLTLSSWLQRDSEASPDDNIVIAIGSRVEVLDQLEKLQFEMGMDPQVIAKSLPSEFECLLTLNNAKAVLDTKGFVCFKQGELEEALHLVTQALLSAEVDLAAYDSEIYNDFNDMQVERRSGRFLRRRSCAVMRMHRMMIYQALGNEKAGKAEARRIEELGFDPNKIFH